MLISRAVLPERDDTCQQVSANGKYQATITTSVAKRLQGDCGRHRVQTRPAELLRNRQSLQPHFAAFAPFVEGKLRLLPVTQHSALLSSVAAKWEICSRSIR